METEQQKEAIMDQPMALHYKTNELNFLQKFLQMSWFSKNYHLDELTVEIGQIYVLLKNGNSFQAPLSELKVRREEDKYERTTFHLAYNGKKIRFMTIPGMLKDEEWEKIKEILCSVKDSAMLTRGKVAGILDKVLNVAEKFS